MPVVQGMKKTPSIRTFKDLQDDFVKRIKTLMQQYQEERIAFDDYPDRPTSLKDKTHQKRAVTSTDYEIHPNMKLNMSLKELLSSSKTKKAITIMFAKALLQHFSQSDKRLVVIYDGKIEDNRGLLLYHTHEEADTIIANQVLSAAENDYVTEIHARSPDTDIFMTFMDLVSHGKLRLQAKLMFLTGKGDKHHQIDVPERVCTVGPMKAQGLIGLHNLSGADWGGKFIGVSKKRWVNTYLSLDENDPIVKCLSDLGESPVPCQLVDDDLPPQLKSLERLVCMIYSPAGPTSLPELRWELFRTKNLEGEMLPPTRTSLLPHICRVNYVCMRE